MLIAVRNLEKSFGPVQVLHGIDLEVDRGQALVILGGSGAGKSVFLRHLAGLYHPDKGQVLVDGVDLKSLSRKNLYHFRRRIGMSFQDGALFDSLTAFENIAFPIRRQEPKLKERDVAKRVEECLELVGMPGISQKMPAQLSGGMRRRVGFARAIALKPEILLFDEPTTGLDPILTTIVNEVIMSLGKQLNSTTITITHDISSARKIADRVAMLFQGRIIHHDDKAGFFNCDNPIVRQFIEGRAEGPATEALYK